MPRPRIHLPFSRLDRWLEVISLVLLPAIWIAAFSCYPYLPEKIPIHYNLAGEADGYGSRASLFLLPSLATFLYLLLTIVNRYPHFFNYLKKITEENAATQYKGATRMLRFLKVGILVIMNTDLFITWRKAMAPEAIHLPWVTITIIGLILLPVAIFVGRQFFQDSPPS